MKKLLLLVLLLIVFVACGGQVEPEAEAETSPTPEPAPVATPAPELIALTTENIFEFLYFDVSFENYVERYRVVMGAQYRIATVDFIVESRRLRNVVLEGVTVTIEAGIGGISAWDDADINITVSFDGSGRARQRVGFDAPGLQAFFPVSVALEITSVTGYVIR